MANNATLRRLKAKRRIRSKVSGTAARPRLTVFRSNKHMYAQLIDDSTGHTLVAASTHNTEEKGTSVAESGAVGRLLAKRAQEAGITAVVFDRNGYRYHGRVKAVADGAREGGLLF
jgi:large subunit ribosomal protein L18